MKVLVVLAVAALALAKDDGYDDQLASLKDQLGDLEDERATLYSDMNTLEGLLSQIQQFLNSIQLTTKDILVLEDSLQTQITNSLIQQANALQQQAAQAQEHAEEAKDLAEAVAADMPALMAGVQEILDDDAAQDTAMDALQAAMDARASTDEVSLGMELAGLTASLAAESSEITALRQQFFSRSCAYGTIVADVPSTGTQNFPLGSFDTATPEVALSVIGFRSHIKEDPHSYGNIMGDALSFNATVTAVSSTQFSFAVTEDDNNVVNPKDVFLRYMACVGL